MPDSPQPWQDHEPVDPTWSAPVATKSPEPGPLECGPPQPGDTIPQPGRRPPHSKLLIVAVPLLAVLLIIGLVWGLGGFKKRSDQLIDKSPGTLLSTGPYEFTFTRATAQRKKDFDDTHYWEVIVIGQGRTTGSEAIGPDYLGDDGMFVGRDPNSSEVQLPDSVTFGKGGFVSASKFTPGLPLTPFRVTFKFSDAYKLGKTIRFGASVLEFSDTSLIGDDTKEWNNSTYFYHLHLPVEVLAEDTL